MPAYRSRTTTHGRNMAGARGLWRATGMKDEDFDKPIIAVANSFAQFVPGHVYLKDLGQLAKGLSRSCAPITNGRFSGGTSGLSVGHVSPEAAEGGLIGLVEESDRIEIDIPKRSIRLLVDETVLASRRDAMLARKTDAWKPAKRSRKVTMALTAYAAMTTSVAGGTVRVVKN